MSKKLVFVHGSGGTGLVWKFQTDHFTDSVAVTLPGRPDGKQLETIKEATNWLKALVDQEGWRDIVLIGHSLGGGIALQYALDYPDDLKSIISVGSGARLRVHPDTLAEMEGMLDNPDEFAATMIERYQKVEPSFAAELRAKGAETGPAPFYYDLLACDKFDVIGRLGEIQTPTHCIVGTEDVMTPPKYSEFLCDRITNASMTVVDGGTHFVFAEYPAQVNQAITKFLDNLASP